MIKNLPYPMSSIGAGGVSTGGALTMIAAALVPTIEGAFVQGYLGSYATTFGYWANHYTCNNIAGIATKFDMSDVASLTFPRKAMYVNGTKDGFCHVEASKRFDKIEKRYFSAGGRDDVSFLAPVGFGHEISGEIALDFFLNALAFE